MIRVLVLYAGRPVLRALSRESAQEYIAQHPEAMRGKFTVDPGEPTPLPRQGVGAK